MSCAEDGSAGGLVASSGFYSDKSVLDDVNSSDAVLAAQSVESKEDFHRIGVCFIACHDLDGKTGLEFDGDAFRVGRRILRGCGKLPHISRRSGIGVFKDTSFVRDVEKILVGRPWLGGSLGDRDRLLGCKG